MMSSKFKMFGFVFLCLMVSYVCGSMRLPSHVVPFHYEVYLRPLFDVNNTIEGYVSINVDCLESSDNITLHSYETEILSVNVFDNGSSVGINSYSMDQEKQFLILHLSETLQELHVYTININFTSKLSKSLKGMYQSSYVDENDKPVIIATTHFSEVNARRAFPCFDEPHLKSVFKISLGRMSNMTSATTMPLQYSTHEVSNPFWIWDHFEGTLEMSTYILPFLISDFSYKSYDYPAPWQFGIYGRPEAMHKNESDYAGSVGPRLLEFYEQYFNISYPLPKCHMAAIPDFGSGAMENWGLIYYRETALLYNPAISTAVNKKRVAFVVSHELVHMWFGNLVTPLWWNDIWLNEGFASYVEYIGTNNVEPTWRALEFMLFDDMQSIMLLDSLETSHPILVDVCTPDEIEAAFDGISYWKGASIIRMMEYFLSSGTFARGLSAYLKDFSYSNAEQDNLWQYLTTQAHLEGTLDPTMSVKEIMDTWTLQEGFPVIKVERDYQTTNAQLSQKRFLLTINPNSTDEHYYSWWVPITFTNSHEKNFNDTAPLDWMEEGQETLLVENVAASENEWVIFNIQEGGFYRVNYDDRNWLLIINQLKSAPEDILAMQRSQIVDDVLNLARAGEVNYTIALSLTEYLKNETDNFPLAAGFLGLSYLDLMLQRGSDYEYLQTYMENIVYTLFDAIRIDDFNNTDTAYPDLAQTFRNVSIVKYACYYNHHDCVQAAVNLFNNFKHNYDINNPDKISNQVYPDLKSTIYCTAVEHGTPEDWDFLWQHYLLTDVATEKDLILGALGCSKNESILNRYLNQLLEEDSAVRSMDVSSVYSSVAKNIVGRPIAWEFLTERITEITEKLGSVLGCFIPSVSEGFNTQTELDELKEFSKNTSELHGSGKLSIEHAIEQVEANVRWMKNHYDCVVSYISDSGTNFTV